MRSRSRAWLAIAVAGVAIFAAACGGDDGNEAADSAAAAASGAASSVEAAASSAEAAASSVVEAASSAVEAASSAADSAAAPASGEPIMIGAAVDLTGNMAPFDAPAIAAAKIQIEKVNAAGGVNGQPLQLEVIDTKLDPDQTKAAAIELIGKGAKVLLVTCDVDFATPAIQEGLKAGILTVAPCIGTDQMGPKRFGDAGKLAFSFGNVAADEGAAMAEYAIAQGWKSAVVVNDNAIAYFKDVCKAFETRFTEQGGEVVATESFTQGQGDVQNAISSVSGQTADSIAVCSFVADLAAFVQGVQSAGQEAPMIGPWSSDGTFWRPEGLSNFTYLTYASVFGDDPSADVKAMVDELTAAGSPPATGGFVTGAATIDGIVKAIQDAGSTDGAALAAAMEAFQGVPTISGNVSFSADLHSVFGRAYRVMTFENGTPVYKGDITASSPAAIG